MSSSCPPQLQLTLQPNTTSFKRSFEQFGFDLASPVEGSEGSSNDGNDRNKRARSETSFSDSTHSTDGSQSSMLASASSSSFSPPRTANDIRPGLSSTTALGPPRLPTPDIEDIPMPDYPIDEQSSGASFSSQNNSRYRLSLGSFNAFDNQDTAQPSQSSSPAHSRIPTPPPVLPPLAISDGQPRLSMSSTAISFLQAPSRPASPLTDFFDAESPSRPTVQSNPTGDSELMQGFRARLSGALERLVPQSPLVPGLELDDREEQLQSHTSNRHSIQESTPLEVPPEPPILPPIPSVSTTADIDHFNIEALFTGQGPVHSISRTSDPSTSHTSISPSLDGHPLPSPILRDLRSWMDGQERPAANGFANPTSHPWQATLPSSRPRPGEGVTRVADNSDRSHNRFMTGFSQSIGLPQETGLWERRSFELGNPSHDETTHIDNSSRRSTTRRSSSPDFSWVDRPPRLQYAFRRRSRLGSSISLVTENSLEARQMADHDHVVRDLHAGMRWRMDDVDMDVPRNDTLESPQDDISSRLDLGRSQTPYVLRLPPWPTASLDVASEAREEEEEVRQEQDASRRTGPPMWYHAIHEPRNHQGAERREQPTHSLPEIFMPSHFEPGPRTTSTFPQYSPPSRPSSPVNTSPPAPVSSPTNAFAWGPQNQRAPARDTHIRRPYVSLTRHLPLSHRREPPPLLPQPDFGHAFVTEGQDRDIEMSMTSQAPGQPHVPYPSYSYLQQPRTNREENTQAQSYVPHSPQSRPPPQFHQRPILFGDLPPDIIPRHQRQPPQPVPNPLEIAGRPRPQPADNRRVLRFALPLSDEAGRFSSSSSPVRNPERMPTISIDNRTEQESSSPLHSSHRTVEPRYSAPMVENVDRRRDSLPAYSATTLDPAAFAPGPFRNTIHQTIYPRMNRPTPPTIPPLSFQESALNSHFQSDAVPVPSPSEENFRQQGPFSRDEPAEFNYPLRVQQRPGQNTEQRATIPLRPPPFASSSPFTLLRTDDENTTGDRRRTPWHSLTTQEERLEAARILRADVNDENTTGVRRRTPWHRLTTQEERLEASRILLSYDPSNNTDSNGTTHRRYSLPSRGDSLRSNSTTMPRQQLINLLHQHAYAEGEPRRVSDDPRQVPHTDGPGSSGARPASNLAPRRFGAADVEHFQSWRTRTRGRFRITPEFLASRIRPGNMGDFIHDDDFDDSYENLVNLAVSIGDVKPKSTPADVLEKLEKGVYKEWKTDDGDKRCPICLDDYSDHDVLLKLNNCNHWFHQACLKQWLHTANTCPVCRKYVHALESSPTSPTSTRRAARRFGFWRGGAPPPPSSSNGGGSGGSGGGEDGSSNRPRSNSNASANNRWSSPLRRRFD